MMINEQLPNFEFEIISILKKDSLDMDEQDRDLIYENTAASKKVMTRIVIENPILSNLLFQMIIFYNNHLHKSASMSLDFRWMSLSLKRGR